jgi:8-oxo-dGTP pyrophosphatase MutT (NUDIX family)
MERIIQKVTAFVTRDGAVGRELLVFRHPYAGIQLPAGTVDEGESPELAVRREIEEETGLTRISIAAYLGKQTQVMHDGQRIMFRDTLLQSTPQADATLTRSRLRRGWTVETGAAYNGFVKVAWKEIDAESARVVNALVGWAPEAALTDTVERHFYHVRALGETREQWEQMADHGYIFSLYWVMLETVQLQPAQHGWLQFARQHGLS